MKSTYLKFAFGVVLAASTLTACKRDKEVAPIGDAGNTLVKMLNGGPVDDPGIGANPIDFVPEPTVISVADVRRDIPNSTELNKTMTVVVLDDTAAVTAAGFEQLDPSWYTIDAATPRTGVGGTYAINFAPGEFSKLIKITVTDPTVLDPSSVYALGFTIQTITGDGIIATSKSFVAQVSAKNPYDGVYAVTAGLVTRYTAPGVPQGDALSGPLAGNPDVILATVGANDVAVPPSGSAGGLFWAVGNNSMVAGIDGLVISVDPTTFLTSATAAQNATFGNWAGKPNSYNPATKTFNLSWRWNPASTTREYEVTLVYKGPR